MVSANQIGNLIEYTRFYGIDEAALTEPISNKSVDVCSPQQKITSEEFLKIYDNAFQNCKDEYFGLHYGFFLNLRALGFISQITLSSTSIDQAIFILQQYFINAFPIVHLNTFEEKNKLILELNCDISNLELKKHLLDTVFCFIYREIKLMIPDGSFIELKLPRKDLSIYEEYFKIKLKKGNTYRIYLDENIKALLINEKNKNQIELLLPKFLQMLDANQKGYKTFANQVRKMILHLCSPEIPTIKQVTQQFYLSERTMQRRLTDEGFSFRKIADDIKRDLSTYLSKDKKLQTQEIAYILGYSESSAYLHALKKWSLNNK